MTLRTALRSPFAAVGSLISSRPGHTSRLGSARPSRVASQREWLRHVATLPVPELLDELSSHPHGLSDAEVERSRAFWGENRMTHKERPSLPRRVLSAFADPFTYILVLIAVVSVLTDWVFAEASSRDVTTPVIIGVMVLVSGVLRFVQETRSGDAAEALEEMIETTCDVERSETGRSQLPLDEVVVGDVIHLSSGDIVPADLRVISARDLFVSQSSLTGESAPVEKAARLSEGDGGAGAVTDLPTLAFLGSTVISGVATGVVVATGARTQLGEVAGSLSAGPRTTSFDEGIASTSRLLMRLMVVMVPAVLVISGVTKGDWLSALLFSLSLAVGLTPEMLPMLVTCCLAKGAVDLSRDKVIVRRLDAIQDLGSLDVLCCDKTGTLTEDRVTLVLHLDVSGNDDPRVLRYAFLNSFFETGVKNLIDSAIIRRAVEESAAGESSVPTTDELVERYHLVDELPFDFDRRRLSVVVGDAEGTTRMICKGALEEVLVACSHAEVDGRVVPLTPELAERVTERAAGLARKGMRVLGVARKDDPAGTGALTTDDERDMVLVGYLAFLDPPKASAADAVRALADHGVAVKVLTGDSARVAAHVCSSIGIPADTVLTGADLEVMSDDELAERLREASVLAKLSPSQKARVVTLLHTEGHAVGFMGDGVNDAAAMQASDCGISVDSAVDVAREAADIILLEKDLMVLERGIEAGRRTYANMIKYVKMTVSSNFGNIISVVVASIALPFLPMGAVQLLLLNLIYDLSCTAIPWDEVDEELVRRPCRWDTSSIRDFMFQIGPVSTIFDLATFAAMFFVVCPAVAGGAWGALDEGGRALFVATFQAGWFVLSMWTQTIAVHFLRTERVPFFGSQASWSLTVLGFVGIAVVTVLPFTPVGAALDFARLPEGFFALLLVVVACYMGALVLARRRYSRLHGSLL